MHVSFRLARSRTALHGLVAPGLFVLAALLAIAPGCLNERSSSSVLPGHDLSPERPPTQLPDAQAGTNPSGAPDTGAGTASPPRTSSADAPPCQEAVCCVGPQCPKRQAGTPCQTALQCETGFCADGVCCNVACQGACVACNQADRMGECLPTAAGAPDPHLLCRQDAPETCGQSGVCNGEGGCAKHNPGVPCGAPRCDDPNTMMPASECDGDGQCVPGAAIACAPFLCEGQGCRVTCTDDRQCLPPRICSNGSCGKRGPGQACGAADQCESGFCVDGVCCENACLGRCTTCAAAKSRGKCVPVPAGNADLRALAGNPDPATVCADQGPASCGANGRCDGKGGCELYRNNTICAPGTCDATANTGVSVSVCQDGRCVQPTPQTCAPFRGCSGNRCSTACTADRDCAAGNVCSAGSCGKRPIGSVCSRNDECAGAGICAQGRCCSATCNQSCMACNLEGQLGNCQPVPLGGADPNGTCRNDACNNGCDGHGSCRRENEGTACGSATCAPGAAAVIARQCTDQGTCAESTSPCPQDQTCQAGRCLPECTGGRSSCGTACVDLSADPDNCASCGHRCDSRRCEKAVCLPALPAVPCPAKQLRCGAACVDPAVTAQHCGGCDHACDKTAPICVAGKCVAGPPKAGNGK